MAEDLHDPEMPLGAHLEELRWRLIKILVCFAACFIVGFIFEARLKTLVVLPFRWAIGIVGPEMATQVGLPPDGQGQVLSNFSLAEGPIASMVLVSYAALFLTVPVILFQVWRFVRSALKRVEARLAFVFLPLAVILFYVGAVVGFLYGMPYLFAFLIRWNAQDTTTNFVPNQRMYLGLLAMMTISFGLVMNIPWLVMVLVRVGLVTPKQLAGQRRIIYMVAIVLAAVLTPPDPYTQLAFFIPIVLLFEIGLLVGRLWAKPARDRAVAAAEAIAAAERSPTPAGDVDGPGSAAAAGPDAEPGPRSEEEGLDATATDDEDAPGT